MAKGAMTLPMQPAMTVWFVPNFYRLVLGDTALDAITRRMRRALTAWYVPSLCSHVLGNTAHNATIPAEPRGYFGRRSGPTAKRCLPWILVQARPCRLTQSERWCRIPATLSTASARPVRESTSISRKTAVWRLPHASVLPTTSPAGRTSSSAAVSAFSTTVSRATRFSTN